VIQSSIQNLAPWPHLHSLFDCPFLTLVPRLVFIAEVTARAFLNADACKRRTLNKSDVARALAGSDQFDFLIDLVPREDVPDGAKRKNTAEHVVSQTILYVSYYSLKVYSRRCRPPSASPSKPASRLTSPLPKL
jgi:hypothetical protein